jgi:hypothetical protein
MCNLTGLAANLEERDNIAPADPNDVVTRAVTSSKSDTASFRPWRSLKS